ncbi:septum formation family protein [Nocardioides montaniterrae]
MADRLRVLLAGLAGVLLLAGCGSSPTAPPPEPTKPAAAPPPPAAPSTGRCYDMTLKQTLGWTSGAKAQACSAKHTTETYDVGTLDTVVDGHLLGVDSARVQQQVPAACRKGLDRFLGGTPDRARLSMVRPVWFTPTVAQSDKGADWFRCDVVVVASTRSLAARTGSLKGVLRGVHGRSDVGMCGTAAPTARNFHRVLCSARHSWRAVSIVPMRQGAYPGVKKARAADGSRCEEAAAAGASNPLQFDYGYEFPTAADWANGQTYGICWAKD